MANYYSTGPPKQAVLFPTAERRSFSWFSTVHVKESLKATKPKLEPYLSSINYQSSQNKVFLSHFHDLIVLACSFKWSVVWVYHYKVLCSIELGLVKWRDLFQPLSHFLSHLYCYQSISIRKQNILPSPCQLSPRSTSAIPGPCMRISQTPHALNSTFALSATILITVLSPVQKGNSQCILATHTPPVTTD